MPGRSGLDVAATVVDEWGEDRPAPLIVFITAYDEFALAAFDRDAIDYVLKPVTSERLTRTVARLQDRLAARVSTPADGDLAALLQTIETLARTVGPQPAQVGDGDGDDRGRLDTIQVGHGNTIAFVPVGDVLFFEATDKYVAVHTREREGLIRMSMRELVGRLSIRRPSCRSTAASSSIVRRSRRPCATTSAASCWPCATAIDRSRSAGPSRIGSGRCDGIRSFQSASSRSTSVDGFE